MRVLEKKDYLCTKISDRKDTRYGFVKNLEVDENGLPTEEELLELIKIEGDRNVAILISGDELSIVSFISFYKL